MPKNMTARMLLIQISVTAALRLLGALNAVIPLDIASMPVRAVHPLEKARKTRKGVSVRTLCSATSTPVTTPSVPVKYLYRPIAKVKRVTPRKM